jgi:hypothetical protein
MLTITPRALAVARRGTARPTLNPTAWPRIARHRKAAAPLQVGAAHGQQPGGTTLERDGHVQLILRTAA